MAQKLLTARVLHDVPAFGLLAGQLAEGPAEVIKELAASGAADAGKDAVAYALKEGAAVVKLQSDGGSQEPAAQEALPQGA